MINVSISVNNYLLTQGVNSVVDQFFYNKDVFRNKQIYIDFVCDYQAVYNRIPNRNTINNHFIIKSRLKSTFFYKTFLAKAFIITFKMILRGRKTSKRFLSAVNNTDILLCQDVFMGYFYLQYREKSHKDALPKIIYMTHIHDDEMEQILLIYPQIKGTIIEKKIREIFNYVHQKADAIVTICNSAKRSLEREIKDTDIRVIYNSVQNIKIEKGEIDYSNIKFVMASSLTTRKGIDLLAKALEKLDGIVKNKCEFHIFGDGICFELLKDTEAKLRNISLKLYGRVEKPYKQYGDKDVFLMTSRDECLPMSILEAMSIGMPIVSTNVGAIDELIIDGVNGIFIEPEINSIVTAITDILSKKYDLMKMGAESRNIFLEKFSAMQWCDSFSDIFNLTLKGTN